jgi:DNA-binding NtrC family response regulator
MVETDINNPDTPILIVDDSVQYSQVLSKILKHGFGYQNVTSVDCVEDAELLVEEDPARFRLYFVDYNLPNGRTGGGFLSLLQERKILDEAVAFLITADPTVDNMQEARKAGALGVVAKPFDREELKKQLQKANRAVLQRTVECF